MERRRINKLTKKFIQLYKIVLVSIVSVLFELLEFLRIYLVVKVNRMVVYKELVEKKKKFHLI